MTLKFSLQIGRVLFWLLLLLAALGVQRCTERVAGHMTTVHPAPASQPASAVLPVAYLMPLSSRHWVPLADTARPGGLDHLHRKASPRNRWLPGQPAYLPRLHRRPPQHLLDSLAAASMRRA